MFLRDKTYRWDVFCEFGRTAQRRHTAIPKNYYAEKQNIPMGCLIAIRSDVLFIHLPFIRYILTLVE